MLILTRRIDETLRIGDDIEVTVLGVKGNQIRFGIEAPKHVSVHREEIAERITRGDPRPTSVAAPAAVPVEKARPAILYRRPRSS